MSRLPARFAVLLLAAGVLASCSDSNCNNKGLSVKNVVVGTVLSVRDGAPQADRDFSVLDLDRPADDQVVATGKSNELGEFAFPAGTSTALIVLFAKVGEEPRSSGLVSLFKGAVEKDLDAVTDIACQAGATALGEGAITTAELTPARIANLERGAEAVLAAGGVDFDDPDAVAAAAAEVRVLTSDGAHGPR